jgi:hypothetical protein
MHTEVRGCSHDNSLAWARVRELERTSRFQAARPLLPILRESPELVS